MASKRYNSTVLRYDILTLLTYFDSSSETFHIAFRGSDLNPDFSSNSFFFFFFFFFFFLLFFFFILFFFLF